MEAKVALEVDGKTNYFRIWKTLSLTENIEVIANNYNLFPPENYALRFCNQDDPTCSVYVTDDNFHEIKDGDFLKVVESFDIVTERIFKNISSIYFKHHGFSELLNISTDEGFIKDLVSKDKHTEILNLIECGDLEEDGMVACLVTLLGLLKKSYIKELSPPIVSRIISFVKSDMTAPTEVKYGLTVLCQILYLKKRSFEIPKEMILHQMSVEDITNFVNSNTLPHLQLNALMLINALVRCASGEKRRKLVKELNKTQNRSTIFNGVIKNKKISSDMAHELYVYQTYMLSAYERFLNEKSGINELAAILTVDRASFASNATTDFATKSVSTMSLNSVESTDRFSLNSMLDDNTETSYSNESSLYESSNEPTVSHLTIQALGYFSKYSPKNFYHLEIEESMYGHGIVSTAEKVIQLIASVLDIGQEPSKTSQFYHPLLFNTTLRLPFIFELFSRGMVMVSRTRKEMKGYSISDYEKIFMVVEKQMRLILEKKPLTYRDLTSHMRSITYETVSEEWERESALEWKNIIDTHPSVVEIKQRFEDDNKMVLFEQRIKILQKGGLFPKIPEKKNKNKFFFLRLSENRKTMYWGDWNELEQEEKGFDSFAISDIQYFIVGKACPHVKDNSTKEYEKAFSIILSDNAVINCIAEDKDMASTWTDAFHLLLGKDIRSENYRKELQTLTEMDCALQLLELQEVPIPFEKPPIPPLPESF